MDGKDVLADPLTGENILDTVVGRGRAPSLGILDLSSSEDGESNGGDGGVTGETLVDFPTKPVKIGDKFADFPGVKPEIIGENADFSPCWCRRWACWSRG